MSLIKQEGSQAAPRATGLCPFVPSWGVGMPSIFEMTKVAPIPTSCQEALNCTGKLFAHYLGSVKVQCRERRKKKPPTEPNPIP